MPVYKFDVKELEGRGIFPTAGTNYGYPFMPVEKLNTPITPRENWDLYFSRKPACWVPDLMYYDTNFIMPDFIPDNVAEGPDGGYDSFGVKWIPCSNPALPAFIEPGFIRIRNIEEIDDFPWPDVDAWPWKDGAPPFLALDQDRINVAVILAGMFERMTMVFGFEDAAAYFLTEPEYTHKFLDKLLEINCKLIRNFHNYFKADVIFFHDDWGAQRAPFFSADIVKEFLVPRFQKMTELCHGLGMKFVHHCCGRAVQFVPLMVECGSDVWQLQLDSNEDLISDAIKKYGDRLLFDVTINCVKLPPNGDEGFKRYIQEQYGLYGTRNSCLLEFYGTPGGNLYAVPGEQGFDLRRFYYESARKIIN